MNFIEEKNAAIEASQIASKEILKIYHQKDLGIEIKEDSSPVTKADKLADEIIRVYLHNLFPTYAFLTEESQDTKERLTNDYVWIVDPVDGTKDFIAHDDEFTINIALAYKHEAVVGVVFIPARDEYYYAVKGLGSFYVKNGKEVQIHVNNKLEDLTCLTSVFHFNEKEHALINKHSDKIKHVQKVGSSIKPCYIAHGIAEITYRISSGTKEWDTAAAQVILEQAGGLFIEPSGKRIMYNREDVYNRDGYIAINRIENKLL